MRGLFASIFRYYGRYSKPGSKGQTLLSTGKSSALVPRVRDPDTFHVPRSTILQHRRRTSWDWTTRDEKGDTVCVFNGARPVLVIRPTVKDGSEGGFYRDAFLHGLMELDEIPISDRDPDEISNIF